MMLVSFESASRCRVVSEFELHQEQAMNFPSMKSATPVLMASIATTAAMLVSATAAHATANDSPPSVTVHFADLNPDSVAGSKTLYQRLRHAADEVCGDEFSVVALDQMRNIEKCKQVAIENAVAEIDQPRLIDLYDRRFPREPLSNPVASVAYIYPVERVYLTQLDGCVVEVVVLAVHRGSTGE
jgi:UrcA family protein